MASSESAEERLKTALADRYTIEREIGSGGMATVYLAEDLKHHRKVAVKVMRPELAADMGADRFLAEIRTTATLSHPHILPLHDSGEADGFLFYVMPYVEGESLRQRLDRDGQLPVEEAVRIAGHVADALDYAHRQGVIHRDIKPANILFEDEQPVVTDFGIALAVGAAGGGRLTETGFYLGTPHYISPEQASGDQTPTAAWDVYSLGCVLYEMLTGDPPHTGSSPQAILGKIFLGEVTLPTKLRHTIPVHVEGVVLKALERLPADRFQSMADLAAALNDKSFRHGVPVGAGAAGGLWNWLAISTTVVAVLALAVAIRGIVTPEPPPPSILRQVVELPGRSGVNRYWGLFTALAPDGSSMVYTDTVGLGSTYQYWVKERGSLEGRALRGTVGAYGVAYSPDGEWIAYCEGADLVKRSLLGGGRETLLEGAEAEWWNLHLHWMDDGTILLNPGGGGVLVRIPDEGGALPDTVFVFPEHHTTWVEGLPGGEAALVIRCIERYCTGGTHLSAVDLQADTTWVLLEDVVRAWYVPSGHLVWLSSDGAVYAASFAVDRLEITGAHEFLFEGVQTVDAYSPAMVMAQDGTVVYVERWAEDRPADELVWVDRAGQAEPLEPGWVGFLSAPAVSPDGRYLAVDISEPSGSQIWVQDLSRGARFQLTTGGGWRAGPVWSPDGATISYSTTEVGSFDLCSMPLDGRAGGACDVLLDLERDVTRHLYTPDGQGLLFQTGFARRGDGTVGYMNLTTGQVTEGFLGTEFSVGEIALSPNGRWLAYTSDATGSWELYVRPFPDVESAAWQISLSGGRFPLWARNGRELFYRGGDRWVTVAIYSADTVFRVEDHERLFDPGFPAGSGWRDWDLSPSGDRFLMLFPDSSVVGRDEGTGPRMIQILNFFTELEERVGEGR